MPECCKYIFKFSHAPYVPKIRKISNYKLDIKYKLLIFMAYTNYHYTNNLCKFS